MIGFESAAVVYSSKRDWWIVLLIWASVMGMTAVCLKLWAEPATLGERVGLTTMLSLAAGFVLWVLYFTRYSLERDALVIRSGPFRWRIEFDAIKEVVPTRNPLSSPACSLDRLRIRHAGSRMGIMISPENKTAFLRDLASRAPGLELMNDRIARRSGG